MCTNPKKIFRDGRYKEDNYHAKKGEDYFIEVIAKCGYCSQCMNEKSNNWVIRNYYEAKGHKKACFITLTYAENTYFLIKKHLQDFMKRLRKKIDKRYREKVRVFYCGEYGTKYHRPHYHLILYGWEEERKNLEYMGINEKNNIYFKSKTIHEAWEYGRTTYQEFETHEIPYITLYQSAKEKEAFEYRISRKAVNELLEKLKDKKCNPIHRIAMIKECEKAIKEMEKQKAIYYSFKEFNGWSIALGWKMFKKNYDNYNIYDWKEYIENKIFCTPTPWIKKLANNGDQQAIKEMLFRTEELATIGNLKEYKNKQLTKQIDKTKKEVLEHVNKKYIM